jgi:two-component system, HptB-dependent secretion and biofilm response regulator
MQISTGSGADLMSSPLPDNDSHSFSVLFVEDDQDMAFLISRMLAPNFSNLILAKDGAEGVRLFHEHHPDIILTDLLMPVMDGIDMLREIRKTSPATPVLLMTATLDHQHLVDAINLGVSRFLPKPVECNALNQAMLEVAHTLQLEKIAKTARQQEVTLLRYRDRYHSQQEELARRKEHHIVSNRLGNLYIPAPAGGGWIVDLVNRPKDIMSGDCYATLAGPDGTLLVLLADAMGYGLSASVTSMITTSFFNHIVHGCICAPLSFEGIAQQTFRHITKILLDDEVFSCTIMQLDPERNIARFASFGMPPLLIVKNGKPEPFRSNNPPISSFLDQIQLQQFDLTGVSDILLSTDGMRDAPLLSGGAYHERMAEDFLSTTTAKELFQVFQSHAIEAHDDDVTIIRLIHSNPHAAPDSFRLSSKGNMNGIAKLQHDIVTKLQSYGFTGDPLERLELALSEALLNAFEHGCLNMGARKQELLFTGEYDEIVSNANDTEATITVAISLAKKQDDRLVVHLEISDPGHGHAGHILQTDAVSPTSAVGRGFSVMQHLVELVRRSPKGNQLLMMQCTPRRDYDSHKDSKK